MQYLTASLFEHCATFALTENGVHRFVQYNVADVIQTGKHYDVREGAAVAYSNARKAHDQEAVNVDGTTFSSRIMQALNMVDRAKAA